MTGFEIRSRQPPFSFFSRLPMSYISYLAFYVICRIHSRFFRMYYTSPSLQAGHAVLDRSALCDGGLSPRPLPLRYRYSAAYIWRSPCRDVVHASDQHLSGCADAILGASPSPLSSPFSADKPHVFSAFSLLVRTFYSDSQRLKDVSCLLHLRFDARGAPR